MKIPQNPPSGLNISILILMLKQTKYQNHTVIVYARNAEDRAPTVTEQG